MATGKTHLYLVRATLPEFLTKKSGFFFRCENRVYSHPAVKEQALDGCCSRGQRLSFSFKGKKAHR